MRFRIALIFVLFALSVAGASVRAARFNRQAQEAPRTWRFDFYQTGGPDIEAYSFDRLVIEPLPWPDARAADLEPRPTGNYRFEIIDGSGKTIFSRGYDPAFAEWVTTAESRKVRRT